MKAKKSNHSTLPKRKATYVAVASCIAMSNALANPYGHSLGAGYAEFISNGNTLTILNTPNTIINWQSFSINVDETVKFVQESAASAVLNRVLGGDPSLILGTLSSNGKVFLINSSGIVFGAGSQINTAGFVASSLNITDDDFINKRLRFNASTVTPGSVINHGEITTPHGGFVYLIAPNVENTGIINTPAGEAVLAAGNSVQLVDSVNPTQRVVVSAQTADINLSQLMQQAGGNIFKVLNSGKISANSAVVGESGKIYLRSAGDIQTTNTSILESKGSANVDGGFIQALAANNGDYYGQMNVSGKNGGFIETSASHIQINDLSIINGSLGSGLGGTWLIDPTDILITNDSLAGAQCSLTGGVSDCQSTSSIILTSTIISALNTGNVIINTNLNENGQPGDITVDAGITTALSNTHSLTLLANRDIKLNSSIDIGNGDLVLDADTGKIEFSSLGNPGDLSIKAGNIDFTAGMFIDINGDITAKNSVSLISDGSYININENLVAKNSILIDSSLGIDIFGSVANQTASQTITISAGGNIGIYNSITSLGNLKISSDDTVSGSINIGSGSNSVIINALNGKTEIEGVNLSLINSGIHTKEADLDLIGDIKIGESIGTSDSFIQTTQNLQIRASNLSVRGADANDTIGGLDGNAYIQSGGNLNINLADSGNLYIRAGSGSTATEARITSLGSLKIGSRTGVDAENPLGTGVGANISILAGDRDQSNASISSAGKLEIQANNMEIIGGNANDASAGIDIGGSASSRNTIKLANDLIMEGGPSSSTDTNEYSAAYIGSLDKNVFLDIDAQNLTVSAGSGSSINSGAIIGAVGHNADLKFNISGNTTLTATDSASASGVLIGALNGNAKIFIHSTNITLDGGSNSSVNLGATAAGTDGEITLLADENINLNTNSVLKLQDAALQSKGRVILSADRILQSSTLETATGIIAKKLVTSSINGTSLKGYSNKISEFAAINIDSSTNPASNSSSGEISLVNNADLILTSQTAITGVISAIQGIKNTNGTDGFVEIKNTGNIDTGAGIINGNIDSSGTGYVSITAVGSEGLAQPTLKITGAVTNYGTGSSTLDSDGNIQIGSGGFKSFGNLSADSGHNITGNGLIDLNGTGTLSLYAENVIGGKSGSTLIPVYANASSISATARGDYVILGNTSSSLTSLSVNSSESVLKDFVFITNNNLSGTTISSDALNISLVGAGKSFDNVNLTSDANVLISGSSSSISLNNSSIEGKNVDIVGKSIFMSGSDIYADENISLFASTISLSDSGLDASGNIFMNTGNAILSNAPGTAPLSSLLSFASTSNISISNGSLVDAGGDIGILAGNLTLNESAITSGGNTLAAISNNLTLNGADGGEGLLSSSIFAAQEVRLAVGGRLSLNSLNSSANISAGSPDTIYLDFPTGTGGFEVDGQSNAVISSSNESTGFFVDGQIAVLGDTLKVRYGATSPTTNNNTDSVITTIINQTTNDLVSSTTKTNTVISSTSNKSSEEKFFDSGKDDKNNKKSQPKQCS